MRLILALLAMLLACVPASAQTPPAGELSNAATPTAYRLELTVDPAKPRFTGRAEIDVDVAASTSALFLHGNGLTVSRAVARTGRAADNRASYAEVLTTGVARLDFARPLARGRHTLVIDYSAPFRPGAEGLYHVEVGGRWYAWTQMQPLDARRMFPGFDEPRHKTPFTVAITAPAGLKAFANAPLRRADPAAAAGMVRHEFARSLPLPTYLVAIAVGDFDVVEAMIPANAVRDRPLALRAIATKGQGARLGVTMRETPRILAMLEEYFGTPYPYEKLDVIASPVMGGAMENAGLVTFDDTLLLLDADAPLAQLRDFGVVMAHELAHQWFGDLVTPRWWDDIWLNESFASWMGDRVGELWRPDLAAQQAQLREALSAMAADSRSVGRPIRQRITRNEDVNSAFDGITYDKGGQVIRMLEGYVGSDAFRRGVRLHLERHRHGVATSEQFFASIGEGARDPRIVAAFRSFVDQEGVPLVTFADAGGGAYRLRQERYRPIGVAAGKPQTWLVPVCASSGEGRRCTLLDGATGALPPVIGTAPYVMPNAGGSGYYRFDLPADGWARLIAAAPGLPALEAMAAADSMVASWNAGRASSAQLLAAGSSFARHPDTSAATIIPVALATLDARLLERSDAPAYRRYVTRLFAPRLAELGLDLRRGAYAQDDSDRRQLRQAVVGQVALNGRDAALRARLVAAARAAVADPATPSLDPAFRDVAFTAAVQDLGVAFMDALIARTAVSTDPLYRRHAASALGAADTPALANHAIALAADKRLQNLETLSILFGLMRTPATRDIGLAHLDRNFDAVAPLLSGLGNGVLSVGSGYCTEERARAIDRLLRPRLGSLGGGELDLDRSLATIRQCAELKAAKGAELGAALRQAG